MSTDFFLLLQSLVLFALSFQSASGHSFLLPSLHPRPVIFTKSQPLILTFLIPVPVPYPKLGLNIFHSIPVLLGNLLLLHCSLQTSVPHLCFQLPSISPSTSIPVSLFGLLIQSQAQAPSHDPSHTTYP